MSKIVSFSEVFNECIFRIPDYQRGYSWGEKELEDLWSDLTNIYPEKNMYHFTGIITVNEFDNHDFNRIKQEGFYVKKNKVVIDNKGYTPLNIVDGQQRLTSLLILLSRLVLSYSHGDKKKEYINRFFYIANNNANQYKFGYHIDVPSHNYLIRNVFDDLKYGVEETSTLYTQNLTNAKFFFDEKLSDFSINEKQILIDKITNRLLFTILNLDIDIDKKLDISMVFETLNFRGKQLSGLERFKNRILYLLSKSLYNDETKIKLRNQINNTWLETYKWLGRDPNRAMDDDAFLKAFWLLKFSNDDMVAKQFKSYQKQIFEDNFNIKNAISNKYISPTVLSKCLKEMCKAVQIWYCIHHPYQIENDEDFEYILTPTIKRSLKRLITFPNGYGSYMINLVLSVLMCRLPLKTNANVDDITQAHLQIERFLFACERHNIICFLLNGNKTNYNQEDTFRSVRNIYELNSNVSINALIDNIFYYKVEKFSWDNVKRNLNYDNFFYSWVGNMFFLREYEEIITGKPINSEPIVNLIYPDDSNIKVRNEFVPFKRFQNVKKNKFSYHIGNMYLSNRKQNPKSFKELKERIKTSIKNNYNVYQTETQLLQYRDWTMTEIQDRGEIILNAVLKKWQITLEDENFWKNLIKY